MKIKPGAPHVGVDPTSAVRPGDGARHVAGVAFDPSASGPDRARPSDPVAVAVDDVAECIARGELTRGEPAVHAVIERVVRRSMGGAGVEARIEDACRMLGDDPAFVARVERMIDRSLAEPGAR